MLIDKKIIDKGFANNWKKQTNTSKTACSLAVYGQVSQDFICFGMHKGRYRNIKEQCLIHLQNLINEYESVNDVADKFPSFCRMGTALCEYVRKMEQELKKALDK